MRIRLGLMLVALWMAMPTMAIGAPITIDAQLKVAQAQLEVTVTPGVTGAGYYTDYQAYVNNGDAAVELFCVENQPAGVSQLVDYEIWSLGGAIHNLQAAWIAENYWNAADDLKGQAQLAIWDLLDTIGSSFDATGTADQILADATGGGVADYTANWLLARNDGRQDYLLRRSSIPEPAPMLLLGTALVSLAAVGRRTIKRQ